MKERNKKIAEEDEELLNGAEDDLLNGISEEDIVKAIFKEKLLDKTLNEQQLKDLSETLSSFENQLCQITLTPEEYKKHCLINNTESKTLEDQPNSKGNLLTSLFSIRRSLKKLHAEIQLLPLLRGIQMYLFKGSKIEFQIVDSKGKIVMQKGLEDFIVHKKKIE